MFSRFENKVVFRVAASILVYSFLLTLIASTFFYYETYNNEIEEQRNQINQLASTVESSAAIAAYLSNNELALDVVKGLVKNDIVSSAMISGEADFSEQDGEINWQTPTEPIIFSLPSPFFSGDEVGRLAITPNQQLIEDYARETAQLHSLILVLYAASMIVLVSFLIRHLLTLPLTRMKQAVDSVQPGYETELPYKPPHPDDEIGQLVEHSNSLLRSIYDTLQREKHLSRKVVDVERRYRLMFEQSSVGIALITQKGGIEICNTSFQIFVRFSMELKGINMGSATFAELFEDPDAIRKTLELVRNQNKVVSRDFKLSADITGDSRWFHCIFSTVLQKEGSPLIELVMYDISERTKREEQYRFEAEYDALTGLFNRRAAERKIDRCIKKAISTNRHSALILVDLDHFKPINDRHGHDAGDLVLVEVAERLTSSLRSRDVVCRWGGDEFLVILKQGHGPLKPEPVATAILKNLTQPIEINPSTRVTIGASLGITITSEHGYDRDTLLKKADDAMYLIKDNGRNGYCIADREPSFLKQDQAS